ncbi:MAG: cytochrome b6-f complex iron-sulfur subunit [Actinomycetota bacterium]|jgi:cytochrome b6-f complex iron-sulfur subunit
MSSSTIVVLAAVGLAVLAVLFVATAGARRDRVAAIRLRGEARRKDKTNPALAGDETLSGRAYERNAMLERSGTDVVTVSAAPAPVAEFVPPEPEALAVTRRQFLNRGAVTLMGLGLAGFAASALAFFWPPPLKGGFGAKINLGSLRDILAQAASDKAPVYFAEARTYVSPYPPGALAKAKKVYAGGVLAGMEEGVVALYQKCVHLGCRVPWCASAQWFECPCHGSRYSRVGEKKGGPAPRGLDRFAVEVENGNLFVDTAKIIQGPALGTDTTGQEAEGPHCA